MFLGLSASSQKTALPLILLLLKGFIFASRFVTHLEFILESIVLQLLTHFPHCGCFKFFDPPPFKGWRLIPLALSAGQI